MSQEQREYSIENPEGTVQQRLWQSVIMDYPYTGKAQISQSPFVQAFRAQGFREGGWTIKNESRIQDYITRWVLAGFTPELYWLVSAGIKEAVQYIRACWKDPEFLEQFELRLQELGINYPNPKAGQYYRFTQRNPETKELETTLEPYPEYVVQLVPEAWAEFPQYLQFERPSVALEKFIRGTALHE